MRLVPIEWFGQHVTVGIEEGTTYDDIRTGRFTFDARVEQEAKDLGDDERWREYKRVAEVLARKGVVR